MYEMEEEENLDFLMEIFNLGVKFGHGKLKLQAFEGIKKHFPCGKLKDDLLEHPEKLNKIVETKKLLEYQLNEIYGDEGAISLK